MAVAATAPPRELARWKLRAAPTTHHPHIHQSIQLSGLIERRRGINFKLKENLEKKLKPEEMYWTFFR